MYNNYDDRGTGHGFEAQITIDGASFGGTDNIAMI